MSRSEQESSSLYDFTKRAREACASLATSIGNFKVDRKTPDIIEARVKCFVHGISVS